MLVRTLFIQCMATLIRSAGATSLRCCFDLWKAWSVKRIVRRFFLKTRERKVKFVCSTRVCIYFWKERAGIPLNILTELKFRVYICHYLDDLLNFTILVRLCTSTHTTQKWYEFSVVRDKIINYLINLRNSQSELGHSHWSRFGRNRFWRTVRFANDAANVSKSCG